MLIRVLPVLEPYSFVGFEPEFIGRSLLTTSSSGAAVAVDVVERFTGKQRFHPVD
jgi:hypothetical protein